MLKKTILWTSVISILILIFYFSSESAIESSERSDMFIIFPFLTETLVRKSAHFIIYMVLAFFVYSLLNEYRQDLDFLNRGKNIYYITILIVLLYSLSDEIHQYFVPGRACRSIDILIDVLGGTVGLIPKYFISSFYKKFS